MLVFILGISDTIDDDETVKGWSLWAWQCGQVEPLWAYPSDINKKHRELRHGAEHDSVE